MEEDIGPPPSCRHLCSSAWKGRLVVPSLMVLLVRCTSAFHCSRTLTWPPELPIPPPGGGRAGREAGWLPISTTLEVGSSTALFSTDPANRETPAVRRRRRPKDSPAPSSSSSSSFSPAAEAAPSPRRKAPKLVRGRNSTVGLPPGKIDLKSFREGLDLTYRMGRRPAAVGDDRKRWGYWRDVTQIKESVQNFWTSINITSDVIPNEMLLRLYDSHGLRHAIYKQGGRETISFLLKTDYIPGDFKKALSYPEVQILKERGVIQKYNETTLKNADRREGVERKLVIGPRGGAIVLNERLRDVRFPRNNSKVDDEGRSLRYRNRTVWTLETVAQACYNLSDEHSRALQLPPLFFPKISDLILWRKANLGSAIRRLGGYDQVIQSLGFIPFCQWNYFCRFFLLIKDLKDYLDKVEGGRREMPTLLDVKAAGYDRLFAEIARNGGRKLVAARLGLPLKAKTGERGKFCQSISYGDFDFDFAVELLEYIMAKCWTQHPRERVKAREKVNLFLPTTEELIADERHDLLNKIMRYGGFENVARRLQLGFKS